MTCVMPQRDTHQFYSRRRGRAEDRMHHSSRLLVLVVVASNPHDWSMRGNNEERKSKSGVQKLAVANAPPAPVLIGVSGARLPVYIDLQHKTRRFCKASALRTFKCFAPSRMSFSLVKGLRSRSVLPAMAATTPSVNYCVAKIL